MPKKYHNGKLINLTPTSKYLGGASAYKFKPKHKKVKLEIRKSPKRPGYKIPKTPKVSGFGWGP